MQRLLILALLAIMTFARATSAGTPPPRIRLVDIWAYGDIVTDSVELPFEKNNLRFYCAPVDSIPVDSVAYDFMLEGYDKTWFTPFREGWYFYTELPAGQYTFHARCRYHDGQWGPEITHTFTIIAPWWRTWWAYIIYTILALALTLYISYLIRERIRLSQRLRLEKEVQQFRNQFVIQASRDFRTPLTIIRTVIEKLTGTQSDHLTRTDIQHLRNSSRLLMQMVEDLMEYRNIGTEISPASINDVIELADVPINKHLVLVIEQDTQLSDIIRRHLLQYVKVQTHDTSDGIIQRVLQLQPQVIIIDTDIEGANAYDIIHDIRRHTNAIIIIISDFDNKRSLIRAIRSEADDYLPKPFNCEVLSAIVIKRLKIWQQYMTDSAAESATPPAPAVHPSHVDTTSVPTPAQPTAIVERRTDKLFIDNLDSYISANLSRTDLDVNTLAEALHLSRGQFGRKVKALRGMSPVEYLREQRLERAAHLMRHTRMTVKEVMQQTGMTDPNNFYRRFRDKYGMSPTEYRVQ